MDISAVVAVATEVGILRVRLETEHQKSGYSKQRLRLSNCMYNLAVHYWMLREEMRVISQMHVCGQCMMQLEKAEALAVQR